MSIKRTIINRLKIVYFIILVFVFFVIGKIIYLQFIEGVKLREKGENTARKKHIISPLRGDILSSGGKLLAGTIPMYQIYMDTWAEGLSDKLFFSKIDSLAFYLSTFYKDKSVEKYKDDLVKARQEKKRYYSINKRKINYIELQIARNFPIFKMGRNKGGFIAKKYNERIFPFGKLAARTIGYTTRQNSDIGYGRVGLEGAYETELRGKSGLSFLQKIGGEWIPVNEIEPQKGNDLITTIDVDLQDIAETSLEMQLKRHNADHGSVILMEVKTGEIKAIANLELNDNKGYSEFYNFAIGEATEPGSTFKLPALMVALEDGYVDIDDIIDTEKGTIKYFNQTIRDHKEGGFGKITVKEAFEHSSNVAMTKIVTQYYAHKERQFIDRLYDMNLNDKLNVEIMGEGAPYIKYPGDALWSGISLPMMSYGYELRLTPLQILTFYNAVANNGKMIKPKFVQRIMKEGKIIKEFDTEVINPSICSKSTIKKAQQLLVGVVQNGTATNLKDDIYKIAGKTGTTQIAYQNSGYLKEGQKNYSASFVGYFPTDNPMYSCIVVISSPRNNVISGNAVAAPVFKEVAYGVFTKYLEIPFHSLQNTEKMRLPISKNGFVKDLEKVFSTLEIKTNYEQVKLDWAITSRNDSIINYKNKRIKEKMVPNVKGMSLKDAIYILENMGLKVAFKGKGMILTQSLESGTGIDKGMKIYLVCKM